MESAGRTDLRLNEKLRKIIEETFGPRGESKFAEFVGIPRSTINSYTRAENPVAPSFENIVKICAKLSINLEWLFYDIGELFEKENFLDKLIGNAVRKEREKRGLDRLTFSRAIKEKVNKDLSADEIREIESGRRRITTEEITLFAAVYGVNFRALIPSAFPMEEEIVPIEEIAQMKKALTVTRPEISADKEKMILYENELNETNFKNYIPILSKTPAGTVSFNTDAGYPPGMAERFVLAPDVLDRNAYALVVEGDSMEPRFRGGDIIVASPNTPVDFSTSAPCVIIFKDDSHQFKVFRKTNGSFEAVSLNKNYPSRIISPDDLRSVHPVVKHIRLEE